MGTYTQALRIAENVEKHRDEILERLDPTLKMNDPTEYTFLKGYASALSNVSRRIYKDVAIHGDK